MRLNILSRNVTDVLLVAIAVDIQDEAGFAFLRPVAEPASPEEDAEFKGHVEPREAARVWFCPGDVVNTPMAFPDDARDLPDPHLAGVVNFQRASRPQAALKGGEHEGLENGLIIAVERAVDKNVLVVVSRNIRHLCRSVPQILSQRPA